MELTPRQRAVCELVARGWSNKRIAEEVGVTVDTVKAHIGAAASRLPGEGPPRFRVMLWFFNVHTEEGTPHL